MGIVRLDGCSEYRWPLLFCPGSSFRSRLSLSDGTGNGPMISLRPSLITEHHSVSSLGDPAREASPCSRYLRPARDVDTTCTVRRNVHESMASKVRARRAPSLLRGCVGRSHVDHTEARKATVRRFGRSDRSAQCRWFWRTMTRPAAAERADQHRDMESRRPESLRTRARLFHPSNCPPLDRGR
jgi:hypothetical protein